MIRDTFFDWHRFVNVCRKEMVESWKANVLRMVLMYGMLAIALIWNAYLEYGHYGDYRGRELAAAEREVWAFGVWAFLWGIAVMGSLSASFTMERMKAKTGRMAMLMTPATMFEKFFARWSVFTFGFLVTYLVAYKLADWTRVLVFMTKYPELDSIAQVPLATHMFGGGDAVDYWAAFPDCMSFVTTVCGYIFLQSCFVLGSSIWPKNAFLKTFAAGVFITLVYVLTGAMLAGWLIKGDYVDLERPSFEMMCTLVAASFLVLAFVNWVLAYFRFKESEIIDRW